MSDHFSTQTKKDRPIKHLYWRMLHNMGIGWVIFSLLGSLSGYFLQGSRGIWAVILASAISAFMIITTVWIAHLTVNLPMQQVTSIVLITWLGKIGILFLVLILLRKRDFFSPSIFVFSLAVAVFGILVLEVITLKRAQIPYVDSSESLGMNNGSSAHADDCCKK